MTDWRPRWVLGVVALIAVLSWTGPAGAQGVLRVGIASNLNTLDPPKMKIGEEYVFNYLAFNALTQIGPDMKVRPDLAERWERAPTSGRGRSISARACGSTTAASWMPKTSWPV